MDALTCECEIGCKILLAHRGNNNEGPLSWLVEGVQRSYVIILEERLFVPLSGLDLQFSFKVHQSWRLELGNVLSLLLLEHISSKSFRVPYPVSWQTGDHLVSSALLSGDDLSRGWSSWTESLGDDQADRHTSETPTSFLLENNFKMSGLGDIEEILWVPAPILVLLTLLINSPSTCCSLSPFPLELLLDCVRKLN